MPVLKVNYDYKESMKQWVVIMQTFSMVMTEKKKGQFKN